MVTEKVFAAYSELRAPSTWSSPSCLQATLASAVVKEARLSQTLPQAPLRHTSSRPWLLVAPPVSLRSPSLQLADWVAESVERKVAL